LKVTKKFEQGINEWMKEASLPEEFQDGFRELVKKAVDSEDLLSLLDYVNTPLSGAIAGGVGGAGIGGLSAFIQGKSGSDILKRILMLGLIGGGAGGTLGGLAATKTLYDDIQGKADRLVGTERVLYNALKDNRDVGGPLGTYDKIKYEKFYSSANRENLLRKALKELWNINPVLENIADSRRLKYR